MIRCWVVAYDIAKDRTRVKAAKILEGFGDRVQDSVFEVIISTERELDELKTALDSLSMEERDTIRFYPLCEECTRRFVALGEGENLPFERPDYIIV